MLPKLDGLRVCELIRRQSQVPIVLLTALDGEAEQLRGFDLRSTTTSPSPSPCPSCCGSWRRCCGGRGRRARTLPALPGLTLTPDAVEVRLTAGCWSSSPPGSSSCCGSPVQPRRVFTREILLAKLWGYDFSGTSGWWTATSRTSAKSWGWTTLRL